MERKRRPIIATMDPDVDTVQTWKKIGGGSLRLNGKIIKPGQVFKAVESEIPTAFRDCIVPAADAPKGTGKAFMPKKTKTKGNAPVIQPVEVVYTAKARGSGGWYDVVDSNGKALNEKALKKDIADKLVRDLAK